MQSIVTTTAVTPQPIRTFWPVDLCAISADRTPGWNRHRIAAPAPRVTEELTLGYTLSFPFEHAPACTRVSIASPGVLDDTFRSAAFHRLRREPHVPREDPPSRHQGHAGHRQRRDVGGGGLQ